MKCNRYAMYGWKSVKGKKHNLDKPFIMASVKNDEHYKYITVQFNKDLIDKLELCEGEIVSQIELEFIPYMGGYDANIEVRFVCNKCKYDHAGDNGLPSDIDSLNKFLTKVIKEM
jgi:hypothetical protein